jgi:hypothetical protein
MKAEIIWRYRRGDADEIVGSIQQADFNTWAQMRKYVESQVPKCREPKPGLELDYVTIDQLGDFADDDGCPSDRRLIATYEDGPELWTWAKGV